MTAILKAVMIGIAVFEAPKCLRIVPDDCRIHQISDGYLPSVVLPKSEFGAMLEKSDPLCVLAPYCLPAKRPERFRDIKYVFGSLQDFSIGDRRHPQFCSLVPAAPSPCRSDFAIGHFTKKVDDE